MQKALPGKTASSLLTRQRENDRALGNVGRSFFLFVVFIFSRFQHPKCDIECYMYCGDDQGQQTDKECHQRENLDNRHRTIPPFAESVGR